MLRQRKVTDKLSDQNGGSKKIQRSPSQLFTPSYELQIPKIAAVVPEFMREGFTKYLKQGINSNDVDDATKIAAAKQLAGLAIAAKDLLQHFKDNPDELDKQIEESNKLNADLRDAENCGEELGKVQIDIENDDTPSFLIHLLKALGLAVISNALPLSVAALPLAAGMQTTLLDGVPQGWQSLCQGAFNCAEGYLVNAGDTKEVLSQIARSVDVSTGGQNSGPDWAYINCLSLDKFAPILKQFYANATSAGTQFCQQQATMYNSNTANVMATNLPVSNCNAFAQNVSVIYNNCKGYSFNVGWIVFGAIAGAVALGALVTLAVCCCRDNCRKTCC